MSDTSQARPILSADEGTDASVVIVAPRTSTTERVLRIAVPAAWGANVVQPLRRRAAAPATIRIPASYPPSRPCGERCRAGGMQRIGARPHRRPGRAMVVAAGGVA